MATLNSQSSLADIEAAYADNASYEEDNSPAKAKVFITACRLLLRMMPRLTGKGGNQVALSPDLIRKELLAAKEWLRNHDTTAASRSRRVIHASFQTFRD